MTYFALAVLFSLVPAVLIAFSSHRHKRHRFTRPDISTPGVVDTTLSPRGSVLIDGELWLARSVDASVIAAKTQVIVVGIDDYLLLVDVNAKPAI